MANKIFCCMQCGRSFFVDEEITPCCCYFDGSKYIFYLADADAAKMGIDKEKFTLDPTGNLGFEFPGDIRFNIITGHDKKPFFGGTLEMFQTNTMSNLWGNQ